MTYLFCAPIKTGIDQKGHALRRIDLHQPRISPGIVDLQGIGDGLGEEPSPRPSWGRAQKNHPLEARSSLRPREAAHVPPPDENNSKRHTGYGPIRAATSELTHSRLERLEIAQLIQQGMGHTDHGCQIPRPERSRAQRPIDRSEIGREIASELGSARCIL